MTKMGISSSSVKHTGEKGRTKQSDELSSIESAGRSDQEFEGIKRVVSADKYVCDFPSCSDLCLCVITWNMNGRLCYKDLMIVARNNRKFDLLVIGLQEAPHKLYERPLQTALHDSHTLLGEATLQSIHLYVFGAKGSDSFLKEKKTDKLSFGGFGGLVGKKKGAVGIRINYKGIPMVFISGHLSAHARNVGKRNSEFKSVTESFFSKALKKDPHASPPKIIVWLGDLNYRIQGIENHSVRNMINKDLHELLTSNDQLLQEAERGKIFKGFREGTLTFNPTYKYDVGSSNYDTSYKVRVPSWTDRILFKTEDDINDEFRATLCSYESMNDIHSSDHKPVRAHICLKLNKPTITP